MRILAIADTRNRLFRRDGDEFGRQARAFKKHWEDKGAYVELHTTALKKNWMKHRFVLETIGGFDGPIDAIAFFCHGWHDGIGLGFTRYHILDLSDSIVKNCTTWCKVILYSCSVYKRSNSFGPRLGRFLNSSKTQAMVFGHKTAGHTTRNPFVWCSFEGNHGPLFKAIALPWYKRIRSTEWKAWVQRLKGPDQYDFWE